MSRAYGTIKNEINTSFIKIVDVINEIIEHRTDSFSEVMDLSDKIQAGSEEFVGETDKIVGDIAGQIHNKLENLDMEKMRSDIDDAAKTFISITEELELLSYNTICRTMALGDKGSTITHISKEIKKYSTSVKGLLDIITEDFHKTFDTFRDISESVLGNDHFMNSDEAFKVDIMENVAISSDVSILIENSQFHDIFVQEMDIIMDALGSMSFNSAYEAGRIFGIFEKAMGKLDIIKYSLQEKLEEIGEVLKDFLYTFNTDMHNIVSHNNILKLELSRVHNSSEKVCMSIAAMVERARSANEIIKRTGNSIANLEKQCKTFRNLVVITAVEVARINDESLRSVVVSMNDTEQELHKLIETLYENIDKWEKLRVDFLGTFRSADENMKTICNSSVAEGRREMLVHADSLNEELDSFRGLFGSEKYMRSFVNNSGSVAQLFDEYVDSINEGFAIFNDKISEDILSSEEFTKGRNDAELKDVLASEDDQSAVEFF